MSTREDGTDARMERYAKLALSVGLNLQPGQDLVVMAEPEHAALVRAVTRQAYRMGAHYVQVSLTDPHVHRALVELAPEGSLDWTPPGVLKQIEHLSETGGAFMRVHGNPAPGLMAGVDGKRAGRAQMTEMRRVYFKAIHEGLINWLIVGCPTAGWAEQIFGRPDTEALWRVVERCLRLDEPDPVAAWTAHLDQLRGLARSLNERRFDALHFVGPQTDLRIGLLPSASWQGAGDRTASGVAFVPNLPTEEVFTTPDRRRTEGVVTATRPLVISGSVIRDLRVRFESGRAVEVSATEGADVVRGQMATDPGASNLGEVALVDGSSRVGQEDLVFWSTLFDENATCHIAYGSGLAHHVADPAERSEGVTSSAVHTDFMIGGPEVQVFGVEKSGAEVPVVRDNKFEIG